MKTIPFILSLLTTAVALGQDFTSGIRYLSVISGSPSKVLQQELQIIGQSGDTTYMEYGEVGSSNKTKYTYVNDKLYMEDSILFFDFGLVVGDTIVRTNQIGGLVTKITIDSIRKVMLGDGKEYPHIFARDVSSREKYTIIKGIGERSFGLTPFIGVETTPDFVGVVSVCRDDTILYWRGDTDPTCDPIELQDRLSVTKHHLLRFNTYPNPVRDVLYLQSVERAEIRIVDLFGNEVYEGTYQNGIDVSSFPKGIYIINFMEENLIYQTKLIKE